MLTGGAFVTFRGTVEVDGRPTAVVSEHDVFELGDALVWVVFTTTEATAEADAASFGRMLLSLQAG